MSEIGVGLKTARAVALICRTSLKTHRNCVNEKKIIEINLISALRSSCLVKRKNKKPASNRLFDNCIKETNPSKSFQILK